MYINLFKMSERVLFLFILKNVQPEGEVGFQKTINKTHTEVMMLEFYLLKFTHSN